MAMLTLAMLKSSMVHTIGICHSVQICVPQLLYRLDLSQDGLKYKIASTLILLIILPLAVALRPPVWLGRGVSSPCYVGPVPHQLAALNMGNIGMQQFTVDAALTGKRESICQAALFDPHAAAELTIDDIHHMVDDLMEAHGDWLPKYH